MRDFLAKLAAWGGPEGDKLLHFLAGMLAGVVGFLLTGEARAAALAAFIAGAIKELYDSANPKTHTADVWDFVATFAGGALVWAIVR